MKLMVWAGVLVGSAIGSWLGAIIASGNWLSGWSIILGFVGALAGVWIGFKVGQNYF